MKEPLNCFSCSDSSSLGSVHGTARVMILKCKQDQIIPLLKTQQSLPMDLRIKSTVFTMRCKDLHDLAYGDLSSFISSSIFSTLSMTQNY